MNRPPLRSGPFAALLGTVLAGPCLADTCADLPPPSVRVERLEPQVELNTDYSVKTLNNLGAAVARPGHQVLGLTRSQVSATLNVQAPTVYDAAWRWECASPQIVLRYGFSPITVYVASEIPRDSCAYREIHAHEMLHVRAYREHVASIEKTLTDALTTRFADNGPWRGQAGQVIPRLRRELDQRWLPMIRREIKRGEAAQALIDSPEEYQRVANACDGEIGKLMRHTPAATQ